MELQGELMEQMGWKTDMLNSKRKGLRSSAYTSNKQNSGPSKTERVQNWLCLGTEAAQE